MDEIRRILMEDSKTSDPRCIKVLWVLADERNFLLTFTSLREGSRRDKGVLTANTIM
jgi:hypothetical protein